MLGDSPIIQFQIAQLRDLVKELSMHSDVFRSLTNFELFLVNVERNKKIPSNLYKILQTTVPTLIDWSLIGRNLNITFSDTYWHKLQEFNLSFSVNVAIKENRYKLLNRWYLTPVKLAKMSAQPDLCWRWGYERTDYFHMWWTCSKLQVFWSSVGHVLSQIIGVGVPVDPRLMLLTDLDHFHLHSYKILLANVLSVASLLIAKSWKLQESSRRLDF